MPPTTSAAQGSHRSAPPTRGSSAEGSTPQPSHSTLRSTQPALTGQANLPNADGEFVVLVAWATPGLAYPITRDHAGADCDYIAGSVSSRFYSNRGEPAKALRSPFDSHYVCIRRDDYQCMDGMRQGHDVAPEYDELVLGDASQLLPCYRLYF